MKNRSFFLGQYLQRFYKEYEKALAVFGMEDKIHITEMLIATVEAYKQEPVDYMKAKTLHQGLQKKYGNQLQAYSNARLSDYFYRESTHHLDLQYELKVEDAGTDENFFTREELGGFLNRVENILLVSKEQYYLLNDADGKAGNKSEDENGIAGNDEKNKAFTARRRALAIHYLDKHLKINPTGNKQPLAEFAHFLTGNTLS